MDEQFFFLINSHHTLFLDQLMYLISQKLVWIPLYVSLLYVICRNYGWRGMVGVLLMVGLGMLVTDWANAHLLRPWIGRLRPSNPDNPIAPLVHIVNGRHGGGCGFPSAHSANIWLLTCVVSYWIRRRVMMLTMTAVAIVVCYSRVYLGFHYPGDILGGLVLALLTSYLLFRAHRWLVQKYPEKVPAIRRETFCFAAPAWVVFLTLLTFIFGAFITA